ncbi:hypothetical protein Tco_1212685 [Tanacetum coccineum]
MIRIYNTTHFQNYEWYEGLEDDELKEEALSQLETDANSNYNPYLDVRQIFKTRAGIIDNNDAGDLDAYLVRDDAPFIVDNDEEKFKERRCKLLGIPYVKPPICKTEKFEVAKYTFGPEEEYVAIKEY